MHGNRHAASDAQSDERGLADSVKHGWSDAYFSVVVSVE
jgi:hypothetical protein